jgi:hypothetical protein
LKKNFFGCNGRCSFLNQISWCSPAAVGLTSLTRGRKLRRDAEDAYSSQLATRLTVSAVEAALHFKHEAYKNEQEYRFLEFYPTDQPPKPPQRKSRVRRYSLIKYTEFDWKKVAAGALKNIVVGPAADHEASKFAKESLNEFGLPNVRVFCSKIPYRG